MKMPFNRAPRRRSEPNVEPLEAYDKLNAEHLSETDRQLELLRGPLQDIAHRAEAERPDELLFLDRSARILGTPYLKFLGQRMGKEAPAVRFYNDDLLKGEYIAGRSVDDLAKHDLGRLAGKKVFIVDETLSSGKGAAAMREAMRAVEADFKHFSLSRAVSDGNEMNEYPIGAQRHSANIEALAADDRFIRYDVPIDDLFTRFPSRLYIEERNGMTVSPARLAQQSAEVSSSSMPDANSYMVPPKGLTKEEYLEGVSKRADALVRAVKDRIYKALAKDYDAA